MNQKKSLLLGRGIFTIIIIVIFGLIIVNEKRDDLLVKKANNEMNEYLKANYNNLLSDLNIENTTINNKVYTKKISSKQNKNHYFYIKYSNHKITDTYKTDYEEGLSILNFISKEMEKEIEKQTNISCNVLPTKSLNDYSTAVKEKIIQEKGLLELKFYYIQKEITIENWNKEEITKQIKNLIRKLNEKNITPKYYEIIITNQKEITTSIIISNITNDFINDPESEKIIEDILNNKDLSNNKITYQYQN